MKDIAKAESLTDPLYDTWNALDFEEKWSHIYQPGPLALQNAGQISGMNGIRGILELYYTKKNSDQGLFFRLTNDGNVSIEVAKVLQKEPLKLGNFEKITKDKFHQHIENIILK